MKQQAPAAARNREAIREVLARYVPASGLVLELSSGTGEHAVHLARAFPALTWQPSDLDAAALASIEAWREEAALTNLRPPVALDAMDPVWPVDVADVVVCINMIHIAPWEAALGLLAGARRTLPTGGLLYLYGPYRFDGMFSAPSNADFDRSLRARDSRWGVRDVRDVTAAAAKCNLELADTIPMPANNHSLVFRKR
ncbi:MAG: DUF938 domain-containing protein [Kofleriaceae bacterium]